MDQKDFLEKISEIFGDVITQEQFEKNEKKIMGEKLSRVKFHPTKKFILGERVQILRVLVRNMFKEKIKEIGYKDYVKRCEKYLDNILIKFDYDLELAIDCMRRKNQLSGNSG